jgi:UDP-glucose 4-epimerase
MKRILLTGATGFVGRQLCAQLAAAPYVLRAALRSAGAAPAGAAEVIVVGDLCSQADWHAALDGVDIVIHAAARAHRVGDTAVEPYFESNARATQVLARGAAAAGVSRFIYLSTIKVNGEGRADRSYSSADEPRPYDAYARSKWLGEQFVEEVARGSAMASVVLRVPLVYGPGVKANFLRLLRWVESGRPIPFGSIDNKRSLISTWNLCDLLQVLLEHPAAPGRVWMGSDGQDLSTAELARQIASAMGRRPHVLAVPRTLLTVAATLTGRRAELARLCGSLTLDSAPVRCELGWSPPVSVTQGIASTVAWYLSRTAVDGS